MAFVVIVPWQTFLFDRIALSHEEKAKSEKTKNRIILFIFTGLV